MIKTLLLAAALTLPAFAAHTHAKSGGSVPADGATVAAVPELRLSFDAPMRVTAFVLFDASGAAVAVERETGLDPVTAFTARPEAPLAPGAYAVEWRGLAADGHPMQGAFAFTVE